MTPDPDDRNGAPHPADDGAATEDRGDALATARTRLDAVNALPVTERPAVFAEINAAIADELAAMDEV